VCLQSADGVEQPCVPSALQAKRGTEDFTVASMPPSGRRFTGTLKLRVPLRPGNADTSEAIFMPRLPLVCGGYVIAPANGWRARRSGSTSRRLVCDRNCHRARMAGRFSGVLRQRL
jgi:hypothetical protein